MVEPWRADWMRRGKGVEDKGLGVGDTNEEPCGEAARQAYIYMIYIYFP